MTRDQKIAAAVIEAASERCTNFYKTPDGWGITAADSRCAQVIRALDIDAIIATVPQDDALTDLYALRALAEAATQGPWTYFPKPKYNEHHVSVPIEGSGMRLALFNDGCQTSRPEQDAKFIAAFNPQTILSLIDRLCKAEAAHEGWRLVPVEPTCEMLDAARSQSSFPLGVYRAMLAAAPDSADSEGAKG